MATVNLGAIKFKWKGTYNALTAYTIDDVVSYNGSSYICIQASTGNLPTNATYFEQMSSAGTNGTDGTDLTTTLTTQGDIVYRDASGLARLGAGTSGQVLQSGGTGANPSWGTVSSDYVKLASSNPSNANTFSLDGYFTSDYDVYKIYLSGLCSGASVSGTRVSLRANVSGSMNTSSNYWYTTAYIQSTVSSSSLASWSNGQTSDKFEIGYLNNSSGTNYQSDFEITVYRPLDGKFTGFVWDSTNWDGTGTHGRYFGSGNFTSATNISGVTIGLYQFGTGTMELNRLSIYGIKH